MGVRNRYHVLQNTFYKFGVPRIVAGVVSKQTLEGAPSEAAHDNGQGSFFRFLQKDARLPDELVTGRHGGRPSRFSLLRRRQIGVRVRGAAVPPPRRTLLPGTPSRKRPRRAADAFQSTRYELVTSWKKSFAGGILLERYIMYFEVVSNF